MSAGVIVLRFVHGSDVVSDGIIWETGGWCSHVEAVARDGNYIGAHAEEGVRSRPPNYDAGKFDRELFLRLAVSADMADEFYAFLDRHLGEPYDFGAIAGFVLHRDLHQAHRIICSAFIVLALRQCGFFRWPLAMLAHQISPAILLLILSAMMDVSQTAKGIPNAKFS